MEQVDFQLHCPSGAPSWAVLSFQPTIQSSLYTICFLPYHTRPTCDGPASNSSALPRVRALLPDIPACCRVALQESLSALPPRAAAHPPVLLSPPFSVVLPLVMAHGQTDRGWTVFVAARLSRGHTLQRKARTYKWKVGIASQWLLHCRIQSVLFRCPKCTIPFCFSPHQHQNSRAC